jgi:hypothetical protein
MRPAVLPLVAFLCGVSEFASAQAGGGPVSDLKACLQEDDVARLRCLDQPPRRAAQSSASVPGTTDHWVLTETTSPVDYSPLLTATVSSRSDSERAPSLLSISCRGGRTELVVTGNGASKRVANVADDVMVAYRINGQQAVQQRWNTTTGGESASFRGDVVSFLRSLPDQGEMSVRVFDRQGVLHEGVFLLGGVSVVRERMAAVCKWPGATAARP